MLVLLSTWLLALALSLDGFAVGIAYGLKRVVVPWYTLVPLFAGSFLISAFSVWVGQLLGSVLPTELAGRLGSAILVAVGLVFCYQARAAERKTAQHPSEKEAASLTAEVDSLSSIQASKEDKTGKRCLLNLHFKKAGLIVQVIKEPVRADMDHSGHISLGESFVLGLALSMDALGAGLGAAMTGYYAWLLPAFIGSCQVGMVFFGHLLGSISARYSRVNGKGYVLPGVILIALGLWKI